MTLSGAEKKKQRPVVGITGGICSGKTTVAGFFARRGFLVIDADGIAHALLDCDVIKERLADIFGGRILKSDGRIDKKSLADIVFEHEQELKKLNSVLHPPVIHDIDKRLKSAFAPAVLDAALLFETGIDREFCTCVVFVHRSLKERSLAAEKRGWDPQELIRREAMQLPLGIKKKRADRVICNTGSLKDLEQAVNAVLEILQNEYPVINYGEK